jgi:hypothetical protein
VILHLLSNGIFPLAVLIWIITALQTGDLNSFIFPALVIIIIGFFKSPFHFFGGGGTGFTITLMLSVLVGWFFSLFWIVKSIVVIVGDIAKIVRIITTKST